MNVSILTSLANPVNGLAHPGACKLQLEIAQPTPPKNRDPLMEVWEFYASDSYPTMTWVKLTFLYLVKLHSLAKSLILLTSEMPIQVASLR